jgi:hypothetical protein
LSSIVTMPRARGGGNGGHVLHLEGERPRRFHEHGPGRRPEQRRDVAARQRIEVLDLDAEAAQVVVAEPPRGTVDHVGDQHVVARLHEGEQRQRGGREAGWDGKRGVTALERRERLLQVPHGGQAVQPVAQPLVLAARRALEFGDRLEQDRRRAHHRRVDRTQEAARMTAEVRHRRARGA